MGIMEWTGWMINPYGFGGLYVLVFKLILFVE